MNESAKVQAKKRLEFFFREPTHKPNHGFVNIPLFYYNSAQGERCPFSKFASSAFGEVEDLNV